MTNFPKYRYSAVARQQGASGMLDVNIYTNQSNLHPVITIKAFVTQLNQKDVAPILDLKVGVFQNFKNGALHDCDDANYSVMYKEAMELVKIIDEKFLDGNTEPVALIKFVHPTLVYGLSGTVPQAQ